MRTYVVGIMMTTMAGLLVAQAPTTTPVKAMRLYSGTDGETHAEEINLSQAGTSQPDLLKGAGVRFATRGPGTSDDWHVTPQRQYLVTLKGHAEIEVGGGKLVQATTGSVLLIEDTTGKGHRARVTNESEWHVMFIALPAK
jgi:quercetin dioxygenase-like cupin family protein